MAIALAQAWVEASGTGSATLAVPLGSNPSAGSLIMLWMDMGSGTFSTPTDNFGDSGGTAWAQITGSPHTNASSGEITAGYWRVLGTGVTGKTATLHQSGTVTMEGWIGEYSGVANSTPVNGTPTANDGNSTTPDPGSLGTIAANAVVIGFTVCAASQATAQTSPAYTNRGSSNAVLSSAIEDLFPTLNQSYDPNWTATSQIWSAHGVAFAPLPSISAQPTNKQVTQGSTAVFSITATAAVGSLSYQWQFWNGSAWANVTGGSGATTSSYTTGTTNNSQDAQGTQYRCLLSDTSTSNYASGVATLYVAPTASIAWKNKT